MFMRKATNKTWVWIGIGAAAFILVDMMLRRKQKPAIDSPEYPPLPTPTPTPGTNISDVKAKYIGRSAYALADGTNVRNAAKVNNGFVHNIVGKLKKGELAGVIKDVKIGEDGKYWYEVKRDTTYSCPITDCGLTTYKSSGFVRSDVVNVVL
jgi:hypothetical protein